MKNIIKSLFALSLIAIFTVQCSKDDDNSPKNSTTTIDATSYTNWKYFSFEKGDTVQITDPQNSLDWDIAFQRYMVKTNGGKSGKGQAAAYKSSLKGQSGMDQTIVVTETTPFTADDSVLVYGYNPANPTVPTETKYIMNGPLYEWFTLQTGAASTLVPNDNIYIVKTATGKYEKLWIKSYYNDADGKPAHITIVYSSSNIE